MILSTLSGPQGKTNKSFCFLSLRLCLYDLSSLSLEAGWGGGGGLLPSYSLYRAVPLDRVWFLTSLSLTGYIIFCESGLIINRMRFVYRYKTNDYNVNLLIVIREDWLWKTTNIKYKNNSATVYVGSSLKVHNRLFSVGKLRPNKLMQRFDWSVWSKWWKCYWTLCTVRFTKTYIKGVWRVS